MPLKVVGSEKKPIFTDLDPNLTRSMKTGDIINSKDDIAVRVAVKNLLSTAYGERLFQPEIGCSLRTLLFEPIDAVTTFELKDRVIQTIRNHEPRIDNLLVDVVAYPDENHYVVNIEYSIVAVGSTDRLSVTLERVR
jgi:phage baseplate assembly protein W